MTRSDKVEGYLEVFDKGFGFLRSLRKNFTAGNDDVFVPPQLIRKYNLKEGVHIAGEANNPRNSSNKNAQLVTIETVNEQPLKEYEHIIAIKDHTSINPDRQIKATLHKNDLTGRILDLITPIGRGQRGLLVSPPKAGKTMLLKHYAQVALMNQQAMRVYILLVDERPEEVTDFKREVKGAHVLSSSSDESVSNHLRITRLTMNAAMRQAESGRDVLVLIDSLTRMGRAFNREIDSRNRTLSGGLGANALEMPRRFFGAARNIENGGSLTILATILVDTGSRMDEIIFQEFKGTGNMELVLSQKCAEQRVFPAININASGTRKEELIMNEEDRREAAKLRRLTAEMHEVDAMQYLLKEVRQQIETGNR